MRETTGPLETQHAVGDYNIATHNSLLGFQIGADMTFRKCRWAWGVESKLGPYINFANQTSYINACHRGRHAPPVFQSAADGEPVSSGHDRRGRFSGHLQVPSQPDGPRGYDFMWITGVALAPEQLQFAAKPVNSINTNGTIFAQGVSLGLEWMW